MGLGRVTPRGYLTGMKLMLGICGNFLPEAESLKEVTLNVVERCLV